MAKKSTEKKTSLEPSEIFCAVGLLMPTKDMRDLVKDQTGSALLKWASSDGLAIAEKGVKVLEIAEGSTIDDIKKSTEAHIIN